MQQLSELFVKLDKSSEVWLTIPDTRIKTLVVDRYIDLYRQYDMYIRKPPLHYVQMIDAMSQDNPAMLHNPFDQVLRVIAILEYDFDNGQNKDTLARSILNERAFIQNKQRLGIR